ncbi:uncharacterized protein LOC101861866 [Aplysia californica]|uniref:Uncharacterized protein LOC101861866 n=1 Tax=Aplysia californica TaxID=6500 RepID=A0ABM1W4J6_APLCA|nr:uncharacterized protein LOC101861866 [Aplysia californica]
MFAGSDVTLSLGTAGFRSWGLVYLTLTAVTAVSLNEHTTGPVSGRHTDGVNKLSSKVIGQGEVTPAGQGVREQKDKRFIESTAGDILYRRAGGGGHSSSGSNLGPVVTHAIAPPLGPGVGFQPQQQPHNDAGAGRGPSRTGQKFTKFNDSFPERWVEWREEQANKRFLEEAAAERQGGGQIDGQDGGLDGGQDGGEIVTQDGGEEKRFLESIAGHIIRREEGGDVPYGQDGGREKRFIESIAGHIIRRGEGGASGDEGASGGEGADRTQEKRYLDGIASSLIKRQDVLGSDVAIGSTGNSGPDKRYLDHLGSSLVKKSDGQDKRYLDHLGSSLVKKSDGQDKRYLDHLGSSLVKKWDEGDQEKRYLDHLGSSLVRKSDSQDKRYLDHLGSSLVKKSDGQEKRYLDHLGSSLVKKSDGIDQEKRYLDHLGSSLVKKSDTEEKRYLDHLGSSLVKKSDGQEKRYLDHLGSSLVKKSDGIDQEKRYLDHLGSSLVKKSDTEEKRYLDHLGSSLVKKSDTEEKRYLDHLGSSLVKKSDTEEKRYLDHLGSSLVKKSDSQEKRYLDHLGSSLVKKSDREEKRYLDHLGSSLVKKSESPELARFEQRMFTDYNNDLVAMEKDFLEKNRELQQSSPDVTSQGNKRYLDRIGSSLVKKEDDEDTEVDEDGVGLFIDLEKDEDENDLRQMAGTRAGNHKRYLDRVGSSLIKKQAQAQKRYLDGIASSLIKKEDRGQKRYLDGIASSLIKKEDRGQKRYLDGIASSLIKKEDRGQKRYLDGIASSLIKKEDGFVGDIPNGQEKRYLDGIASSLIKKNELKSEKRYLDGIASSLIKKDNVQEEKRYLDGIASSLIKKEVRPGQKRYLDGIASSLIKKDSTNENKRYLDGIASSLIKRQDSVSDEEKRYLDSIGSSLVRKSSSTTPYKRYLDQVGSSLVKKGASEMGPYEVIPEAVYVGEGISAGGEGPVYVTIDGQLPILAMSETDLPMASPRKRMYEVTDDVMTGSGHQQLVDDMAAAIHVSAKWAGLTGTPSRQTHPRIRRDTPDTPTSHSAHPLTSSPAHSLTSSPAHLRQKRFIESIAGNILYKRTRPELSALHQGALVSDVTSPGPAQREAMSEPGFVDSPAGPGDDQSGGGNTHIGDNQFVTSTTEFDPFPGTTHFSVSPAHFSVSPAYFLDSPTHHQTRPLFETFSPPEVMGQGHVFQKRYLDDVASSLLHKRYLDTVASSLFKRLSNLPARPVGLGSGVPIHKRFTTESHRPLKAGNNRHMSSIKRYIDSIASDLIYRKRPRTLDLHRLRAMSPFQMANGELLTRPRDLAGSRERYLENNRGRTGHVSTVWSGRPTAMDAVRASGVAPGRESSKAYLREALREYVRGVATEVLDRTKVLGQSLTDGGQRGEESEEQGAGSQGEGSVEGAGSPSGWTNEKPGWGNEAYYSGQEETRDFFDSLAGGILT